nr:MAG TPA: hypothetical protein [Caudoviricetes sp.]
MSTNRPTRTAYITAIVATAALILATFVAALAAFEHGQYRHHPRPHHTQAEIHEMEKLEPSYGKGWDSPICKHSPKSPRCMREGGNGMMPTRGGHALRPANDSLDSVRLGGEGDAHPVPFPGRVPGRGGWVSEEGVSQA